MKEIWTDGTNCIATYEQGFQCHTKREIPLFDRKGNENKDAGKETLSSQSWHSTLASAIKKTCERTSREKAKTLKDYIERFEAKSDEIIEATKGL